jgi:Holliday junction resolvasome RuvABC endonuclease subunit
MYYCKQKQVSLVQLMINFKSFDKKQVKTSLVVVNKAKKKDLRGNVVTILKKFVFLIF